MKIEETPEFTVLVVDDNPDNLNVLIECLNMANLKTLVALDGESALRQIPHAPPDLILLDVMMPGIDGFETCRRLKADPVTKDIPVIFLTALTETTDKIKGFAVGGSDYITKPVQHEEVLARVHTHLTLRKQQQQLSELNASKDKFFSIIAHDLKNPLVVFRSYIDLLMNNLDDYSKEEIKELTGSLEKTFENFQALLENLLTWSRLQQGVIDYFPQQVDLSIFAERTCSLLSPQAEQKNVGLRSHIEKPTVVYADMNMIDTVFRNLVTNALKFTHAGGSVTLSAVQDEQTVTVSVADTGVGIQEPHRSRLFRIDSRHQKPGTAGEKGTGLGLILCKEFIEKNDGVIWVESDVGKGTTFRFTLPAEAPGESDHGNDQ